MKKSILNIGTSLSKVEQKQISGGNFIGDGESLECGPGTFVCNCESTSFCALSVQICINVCGFLD